MNEDRQDVGHDFPEALRLVQSGYQVRRAGWASSLLYVSLNWTLNLVELVREEDDAKGHYCYATPWLGGAAIGGPPMNDLLSKDWTVVEDSRVPTREGAELAESALHAEIADEERRA
jgi:hypothetical protein